ncbi:hypothetical protein P7D85_10920 [Enterococcus hulanensis]|uniref:Immunity protein n=1 Tax=Enterococcus hulanensis TaxID=2559929 RepID=A0ABU3F198_9ENTE|nr:hypothetical protein [Enterococcus hulanensis]MDT2600288.1 hypothetical protein [Enterococcus hulanensis]MDT2609101.1 hypothetical protein [Enterococcus hulanensis]MDT2616857.1 hypothetical protein [Enterococcus hulanensis]MDT2628623.1 hypothetical protein [Enterococcus hulanensis]MDT2655963.1 hypothetical protein [Enterococcus hulanensis]
MYNYVWLSAGMGVLSLILAIFFLVKDLSYCEQTQRKKLTYLLANWGMFLLAIVWIGLGISLYVIIQNQLTA